MPDSPVALFRVRKRVREFEDARSDDIVIYRPRDPDQPVLLVREVPAWQAKLLADAAGFELLYATVGPSCADDVLSAHKLGRRARQSPSHLRVMESSS